MAGKLKIGVLFDRWEPEEEDSASSNGKAPLVRTLDKKEVEDEVAETLTKLGHEPIFTSLMARPRACMPLPGSIAISYSISPSPSPETIPPTSTLRRTSSSSASHLPAPAATA